MRVELDLIENSYDFLLESLSIYKTASFDDMHDPQKANVKYKKKLKNAFVLLVQATELILKEVLNKINPALIFENIDAPNIERQKTIQYLKSIERIYNLKSDFFSIEEKQFLENCGKLRNDFIHFKPNYESFDLKMKYCKLYALYKKIYRNINKKKLEFEEDEYRQLDHIITRKSQKLILYRGIECTKKQLDCFKSELEKSQKYSILYDEKESRYYYRVIYGKENELYYNIGKETYISDFYTKFTYCDDCVAKQGEYHLLGCDLEPCPKCGEQLISCDCEYGE